MTGPRDQACARFRELASARIDGETTSAEDRELAAHQSSCVGCAAHARDLAALGRRLVTAADAVPDLTADILTAVPTPRPRRSHLAQMRAVLAFAGVAQLIVSVPVLLGLGLAPHASREAGVFEIALAVGFLVAARRPERAAGLLPVALAVAGLVVVTAVFDLIAGHTTLLNESTHLVQIVGTGILWALDRRPGRLRPATT